MQFAFFLYATRYHVKRALPVQVQKGNGLPPLQQNFNGQIISTRHGSPQTEGQKGFLS